MTLWLAFHHDIAGAGPAREPLRQFTLPRLLAPNLPRVPRILEPTRWNIGAKFGESPHSRTRTRRKNFGFTYHESSPPDLQPSTSGTKLAPQYQSECGRYGSAET